jgi:hypothetical protein
VEARKAFIAIATEKNHDASKLKFPTPEDCHTGQTGGKGIFLGYWFSYLVL